MTWMLTYPICTIGNSIILAENLTDLSSPAAFADKAMQGLSAKQVLHAALAPAASASSSLGSSVCCTMPTA